MEKLAVFNGAIFIDSTLSGFALLADAIGKKQEMLEHEAYYYKVRKKGPWGSKEFAAMFKGVSQEKLMKKARAIVKKTLMKGSRELVKAMKKKGYFTALYTTDPLEITLALQEQLELDDVFGTVLEYKNGICTGNLKQKFDRYDRAKKIKELVEKNNLQKENVVIIGDSITAIPSKPYGKLIAFNTEYEELKKEADELIEGKNLMKIGELLGIVMFLYFLFQK
jgi:phosphoserine phosphatase